MKKLIILFLISLLSIKAIQFPENNRDKKICKINQHKKMWNDLYIPFMNEIYIFLGVSLIFLLYLMINTIISTYRHIICKKKYHKLCSFYKSKI